MITLGLSGSRYSGKDTEANFFEKDDLEDNIKQLNDYMSYKFDNTIIKYGYFNYFNFHSTLKEKDSFVYLDSIDEIFKQVYQISGIKIKYVW